MIFIVIKRSKAMIDIIISVFGCLATAILVFSTIPQAVRTLRTQETSSLSLWMLILALTSGTLFVIYGTLVCIYTSVIAGAPIAVGNFLYLVFQGMTFGVKVKNIIKGKDKK